MSKSVSPPLVKEVVEEAVDYILTGDRNRPSSSGAYRTVAAISDDVVVKYPTNFHNRKAVAQSYTELDFYKMIQGIPEYEELAPKLLGHTTITVEGVDVPILFLEKVTPIEDLLDHLYSLCWNDDTILSNYYSLADIHIFAEMWYGSTLAKNLHYNIGELEDYTSISDLYGNCGNWGIAADGRIVVIDAGLTYNEGGCRYSYSDQYPYYNRYYPPPPSHISFSISGIHSPKSLSDKVA